MCLHKQSDSVKYESLSSASMAPVSSTLSTLTACAPKTFSPCSSVAALWVRDVILLGAGADEDMVPSQGYVYALRGISLQMAVKKQCNHANLHQHLQTSEMKHFQGIHLTTQSHHNHSSTKSPVETFDRPRASTRILLRIELAKKLH